MLLRERRIVWSQLTEPRERILPCVRTYHTLSPSKEKMKFIKRGYSLECTYPRGGKGELSFARRIWKDGLYCVCVFFFKFTIFDNDRGRSKSLTKLGARSVSPLDPTLAYEEGRAPSSPGRSYRSATEWYFTICLLILFFFWRLVRCRCWGCTDYKYLRFYKIRKFRLPKKDCERCESVVSLF